MKKLEDVPAVETDVFLAIDEIMTGATEPEPRMANKKKPTIRQAADATDLGRLDVAQYLGDYGVSFRIKERGGSTIYTFDECLFDPTHRGGEAGIIQRSSGALGYNCFHNSCQGKGFKDARRVISGDDKIAQFYSGYDQNWKPPKKKQRVAPERPPEDSTGKGEIYKIEAPAAIVEVLSKAVPPPEAVDPLAQFFEPTARSSRFVPIRAAEYLAALLGPICYTNQTYWRYSCGVWSPLDTDSIKQILVIALKDKASNGTIDGTLKNVFPGLVARREDQWPSNSNLLNVQNGMVDLERFTLIPHASKYGSRVQLPVSFTPEAEWPLWDKTLIEIFEQKKDPKGFQEKYELLQEFAGYCFMESCRFEAALFLVGNGSNGKSVVIKVLSSLFGKKNVSSMSFHALGERFGIIHLQHKMVNFSTETDSKSVAATELLKKAVGGELVTAEQKYGKTIDFCPRAKFIFSVNKPPVIVDDSFGFFRRWGVLNFNRRFSKQERDTTLASRIIDTEKDGVFQWALLGLARLLSNGDFSEGVATEKEKKELFTRITPIQGFIDECLNVGETYKSGWMEVYGAYKRWAADNGLKAKSTGNFFDGLQAILPEIRKRRSPDSSTRTTTLYGAGLTAAASAAPSTR